MFSLLLAHWLQVWLIEVGGRLGRLVGWLGCLEFDWLFDVELNSVVEGVVEGVVVGIWNYEIRAVLLLWERGTSSERVLLIR